MKIVEIAVLGAGQRACLSYGFYVEAHPDRVRYTAVAEPDEGRRARFASRFGIAADRCFATWEELLAQPKLADAVLVATQDRDHYWPTMAALARGYHVLLEKPMATTAQECIAMGDLARRHDRVFAICHVLRYTGFFRTLKALVDGGRIGRLMTIQHNENVGYWHQAHSFVRGNWRDSTQSSPMILAKSCHDMDILLWLAGADCSAVASFGSLGHFRPENAPFGAPHRCLDGCPVLKTCAFSAPQLYLTDDTGWPTSAIGDDLSMAGRERALREGPYGRCVYRCDNNVVDHQVVSLEFTNGVTAAFTMSAFTHDVSRTLKLMGTEGEIRAAMEKNQIEVHHFASGRVETIQLDDALGANGHGGGDFGLMEAFVAQVAAGGTGTSPTSADQSVQSHLMAFAAETARLEGRVVRLGDGA